MSVEADFTLALGAFRLEAALALPARGVSVLFGPSGSGKTSLLRCIAGLEPAARGRLAVSGETWQDSARGVFLPPHRRGIGMVFQEASLFPHLDVRRNLEYGLRRIEAGARRVSRDRAIELLGIGALLARRPDRLSGGERQRVAIARALLTSPQLLLLDEPLSALDYRRKQDILPYLDRLHRELDLPMIYVTHATDELSRLADHLVLLDQGRVVAQGALSDTLSRLDLPPVFDDEIGVVLEATVLEVDAHYQLARLAFAGGELRAPAGEARAGERCRVRIPARDVSLARSEQHDASILNRLPAVVTAVGPAAHPAHALVRLDLAGATLVARITRLSLDTLAIAPGERVWAQIKSVALL
ncbi:molybdenum ABC transporter ATP-binding protein [Chitinimonas koreensis]|uniref:molybdenum ABC transporter ATP-binding protein n=1 Tax=Chitinimonas koreensis TaxID=356302 RepID=UPI0004193CCF|nr:molybdenum ABC transporter ATP-binding protein [Chitinimonas koreensis]QNM94664.1 molybdenum ABC transporter ATP-binding protein [Chitinimonas koreensis]